MLSALLRICGVDGLNMASASNPLPVQLTNVAAGNNTDTHVEVIGTTGAATSLTIPAIAGKTIVITSCTLELFSTTARAAAAARPVATISNLSSAINKTLPNNATTIGTVETIQVLNGQDIRAAAVGTNSVVSVPAIKGCITRIHATYLYI